MLRFGILFLVCAASASTAVAVEAWVESPDQLAARYIDNNNWAPLEELIEKYATSGERTEDGRFKLFMLSSGLNTWFQALSQSSDAAFSQKFKEYRAAMPRSAFAPILEAMQTHAAAWRARGNGLSSSVTPEGWQLFRERNEKAWQQIQDVKEQASRLPVWYEQAIAIASDADVDPEQITAIFNEGIQRFPGYHSLYFGYMRQFSPRWGGSYQAADAFINAQVSAKTNPDGEMLYTRLYWGLDQSSGRDPGFFENSLVSWPRMRKGFEQLMQQFPKSERNKANLVAYACRANDAVTYYLWRKVVSASEFEFIAPQGISLEVCDARFTQKV